MRFDTLADRLRTAEDALDHRAPDRGRLVLRLDGRGFTRLTKQTLPLARPVDAGFHDAMARTAERLMQAGPRVTLAYTVSDEISLLLAADEGAYGRRIAKLVSVFAGEASAALSLALGHPAAFDARVSALPDGEGVIDYLRWRAEDGRRNALSTACHWHLLDAGLAPQAAAAAVAGMDPPAKAAWLRARGVDPDAWPAWRRQGALLAWPEVPHVGRDPRTGAVAQTVRRALTWADPMPEGAALGQHVRALIEARA
ncbi:MAG: tRNA(His) guanylyltransferase Thg1 family protein [Pseudomonadota bacterium]